MRPATPALMWTTVPPAKSMTGANVWPNQPFAEKSPPPQTMKAIGA